MGTKLQAIGVAVLSTVFVNIACTMITPSDGTGGATSSAGNNALGGAKGKGGNANNGGRGGTSTAHGGDGDQSGGDGDESGEGGTAGSEQPQGEAGAAPQCPSCASGFCFLDGTCVDCLPSHDNCPNGTVCGATNTCEVGCKKDGSSCASGVCANAHDCQNCIGDEECGEGNLCGDNRCAPACRVDQEGTGSGCGAGLTCCSLHCIDQQTDSENCGACGSACAAGQFCGLSACGDSGTAGTGGGTSAAACVACHPTTIANVCAVPKIAVVLDGQDGNAIPGRSMANALVANCHPAPTQREVSQTVPDVLNPASGRPVSGAHELLVAAGSSFFARVLGYVDSQKIAPVYFRNNNQILEFRESKTDKLIIGRAQSEPIDAHDYFIIQLMRDSTTGSLVLNAEGFWLSGTVAAAFFFENGMLPNLNTFGKSWYAYDWTDKDGDLAPDLDEMTLVASGP